MTLKRWLAAAMALLLLTSAAAHAAGGGTSSDPVATRSYIEKQFVPKVERNLNDAVTSAEPTLRVSVNNARNRLDALPNSVSGDRQSLIDSVVYEGTMRALDDGIYRTATVPTEVTLGSGEQIIVKCGGEMTLLSGSAEFSGERSGGAVCATNGYLYYGGLPMSRGARYVVVAEDAATGAIAKGSATLLVQGSYQLVPAIRTRHTDAALALQSLGLMRGTDKGFELERGATRLEALIMFLRLIGEEDAALAYTGTQPFTDLPVWGGGAPAKYVGYAWSKGYTNGVSETRFGASDPVTFEMYATFILRALGYSEAAGDFSWVSAPSDAVKLGVLTSYERESIARRAFCRDSMAYISWQALDARNARSERLYAKLINAEVFTSNEYRTATRSGVRVLGE